MVTFSILIGRSSSWAIPSASVPTTPRACRQYKSVVKKEEGEEREEEQDNPSSLEFVDNCFSDRKLVTQSTNFSFFGGRRRFEEEGPSSAKALQVNQVQVTRKRKASGL